jgi:hypothetical protein
MIFLTLLPLEIHRIGDWTSFVMAGSHTIDVVGPSDMKTKQLLADLLYQPNNMPLQQRASLYISEYDQWIALTGNQTLIYRGQVSLIAPFSSRPILAINQQPIELTDGVAFKPCSGYINLFTLQRQLRLNHDLENGLKIIRHIYTRRDDAYRRLENSVTVPASFASQLHRPRLPVKNLGTQATPEQQYGGHPSSDSKESVAKQSGYYSTPNVGQETTR